MQNKVKKPFTLLELVIAMGVAAILVGALFSLLRQTTFAKSQIKQVEKEVHARQLMQIRLTLLFSSLPEEKEALYTASHPDSLQEALYFLYNNPVDADPRFIGMVQGALVLNAKDKHLYLYTTGDGGAVRRELLLEKVAALSFAFFHIDFKQWEASWSKERQQMPALVKIWIQNDKKGGAFAFHLKQTAEISYK